LPIRWRLTLFIALAIGVILLALGLAIYLLSRNELLDGVKTTAENGAKAVADTIESGETLSTAADDDDLLFLAEVAVIIRDKNGEVLREWDLPKQLPVRGAADFDLRRGALKIGEADSEKAVHVKVKGNDYYVYSMAVDPPPSGSARVVEEVEDARVVQVLKSNDEAEETLEVFGTVLATGIGAAFLLSIGGAYLLAGAALKPVDAVTSAARRMGEGDLSKRLPVANPKDELGRLVITINALLSRLEAAFVRLEAAFARREEALERQRRFAADASHELRTPLTAISGHARMLKEWALEEDPERAKRSIGVISREADRMRSLAESLLALARGDEGAGLKIGRHDLVTVAE
jgi:two-component system, OmpR family, sensor kinase